ncbi:DnaJ domain-containing protein [Phenylobacterium sp.]|uniref:DnaJ domain-containing protein n=1 Tax=Phenylobacterium sp. TaxID=1871053 RepID=UPI002F94EEDA
MADRSASLSAKAARDLLGVGPLASAAEIRRAFREAAKHAHPDRPGGSPERFRAVTDAYQRLQAPPRSTRERIAQPPAPRPEPTSQVLEITPQLALAGGGVEHRLAGGRQIRITLPAGLRSGDTVRAGEAELSVVVRAEGDMLVRGDDLWITVPVAPRTLAEGGRVTLETPLGRRIVWITRKAAERGLVRLVGQGLPARGAHAQGHLFLRLAPQKGEAHSAAGRLLRRFAAAWAA